MNLLILKIVMMPLVIGCVSLISKKWGNSIGGLVASMPWIAGPIVLFFSIEQGIDFTIQSLKGVMIGITGILAFIYAYTFSTLKFKWYFSLFFAYLAFLLVSLSFKTAEHQLSLNVWYALTVVLIFLGIWFFPAFKPENSHVQTLKYDIYLRMVIITVFVILITYLAKILGPTWSGILAPFPVITAILAAFTHYTQGAYGTSVVLKGMVSGLLGFATFLFLQSVFLPVFSIAISFIISFLANILLNVAMRQLVIKVMK